MSPRFAKRLLFGTLLVGMMLGAAWVDVRREHAHLPVFAAPLLAIAIALAAVRELLAILAAAGMAPPRAALFAASAALLLGKMGLEFFAVERRDAWFMALVVLELVAVAAWLLRDRDVASGARRSGAALLALAVALLLSSMIDVAYDFGSEILFALVLTSKAGDSGAYLVGKSLGRHKLIEHVSPKKTVEGALGGLVGSLLLGGWLLTKYAHHRWSFATVLLVSAVVFVAGHVGDLFESLWKRAAGVKDSGRLLPEFGGALDLVDSLFLAVPAGFALLHVLDLR